MKAWELVTEKKKKVHWMKMNWNFRVNNNNFLKWIIKYLFEIDFTIITFLFFSLPINGLWWSDVKLLSLLVFVSQCWKIYKRFVKERLPEDSNDMVLGTTLNTLETRRRGWWRTMRKCPTGMWHGWRGCGWSSRLIRNSPQVWNRCPQQEEAT